MTGGDNPCNRATDPWPDEGAQPDMGLREQFYRLIAMRHAHPVRRRSELIRFTLLALAGRVLLH